VKRWTAFLTIGALILSNFSILGLAQSQEAKTSPKLPLPSGSFGVGRTGFVWVDPTRPADMTEDIGPHAEVMVYLWYPARARNSEARGVLFPGAKQIDPGGLRDRIFGGNWPLVVAGEIKSHAQDNAEIAKSPRIFPIVVFSPGAFGTSFQYSSAIEDLVSHGYIVAAIEHTSETFGVAFPDGKVHIYSEARIPKKWVPPPGATREEYQGYLDAWNRHCLDVRAKDESFVIDKLIELNKGMNGRTQFLGRLDLVRLAAVGHSRGGWSSIVSCRRDSRIKACVNEDGNAGGQGLAFPGAAIPTQPVLYVEISPVLKPETTQDDWIVLKQLNLTAKEWVDRWHETVNKEFVSFPGGGYFVQLTAPELEHYSFSDEVILRTGKEGSKKKQAAALHNQRLTEDVTRAFLDEVLRNQKPGLLQNAKEMAVERYAPHH